MLTKEAPVPDIEADRRADDEWCPETLFGSHELVRGNRCGWCGALLSLGRWYPPAPPGSGVFAGFGGCLDLGLAELNDGDPRG